MAASPESKRRWKGVPEAGSYLRLIDSCITQLKAQGPSRTCNESKEEEKEGQQAQHPVHQTPAQSPPWRQPRGKWMVSLVNSHTNATRIGRHLWEIDLRFRLRYVRFAVAILGINPMRKIAKRGWAMFREYMHSGALAGEGGD